jgi:imidazolonepropionase-like amidohydrolase
MGYRLLLCFALFCLPAWARTPSSWGEPADKVAFSNATIMVAPGQTIAKGTLLVASGKVVAVGSEVAIPSGTLVVDLGGKVIHPGFLDPYVVESRVSDAVTKPSEKPQLAERVHDEWNLADTIKLKPEAFDKLRALGFVAVAVVPEHGIARGQAALYHTGRSERPAQDNLWRRGLASVIVFEPLGWEKLDGQNYPLSLVGNVAFVRQLFLNSAWHDRHSADPGQSVEHTQTLASLKAVRSGERLLLSEASSALDVRRLSKLWTELAVPRRALVLSGREWQALDWLKGPSESYILPIAFPKTPKTGPGQSPQELSLAALREWHAAPGNPSWLAGRGVPFSLTTHRLKGLDEFEGRLQDALAAGLSEERALAALTTEPAKLLGLSDRFGTLRPGMSASFVVRNGAPFSGQSQVEEVCIEGRRYPRFETLVSNAETPDAVKPRDFIVTAEYRDPPRLFSSAPFLPSAVLVKGATVWTQEPGEEPRVADLLVRGGKIVAVGQGLAATGAQLIEGRGLHVTPGLIDAHSHTAVEGDVNEPGRNVTAMVAMKDVLNPFDHDIYLQLASGVTVANILHGSANAIGGQSITVKWRWGSPPEALVMQGAPEGIKFALGENPKQSNWGDVHSQRYPQSRLGVNELIHGAFSSAKNYRKQKQAGLDPEPDLALEALLEVLDGKRLIHCHSYRQDEILALIRLAEEEGFKVAVFQHVLEGYKVADEIAKHGGAASTFADWWAYKVEVEDAIPHNAALMAERGVLVSVNSDSPDLARRLNTEAGKSVRYGGMSEAEALALVTRNPAQQLGIADRVGTLSAGKDADFVIWSAHPLSQEAICLETWIEGRRYYQQTAEAKRVQDLAAERARLIKLVEKKEKDPK